MRDGHKLTGRTLYIHPMTFSGSYLLAACFRSVGVHAELCPPSNERTLELGGKYSSGDECFPEKVTLGDYMRLTEMEDFFPEKTAFFMPTAGGPCRFGQYSQLMRQVLDETGNRDVMVFSPTGEDGYDGVGAESLKLMKRGWLAILCSDILRKLTLKTRPYELNKGDTDRLYHESLDSIASFLEDPVMSQRTLKKRIVGELVKIRDKYRAIPADYTEPRPLIGVVGEIFCRLNTFTNEQMVKRLEDHGAEAWMADVTEWLWYTNFNQKEHLRLRGKKYSLKILKTIAKNAYQHHEEVNLLEPFKEDFFGCEEPTIKDVLNKSYPYLPYTGVLGEMVLSTGKAIYMYEKGVDGIVDISPFTCMNGIVCEAIYPKVSHDHDNIPMRLFYFDGTQSDLDRDVGIFLELVHAYRKRKTKKRKLPFLFAQ